MLSLKQLRKYEPYYKLHQEILNNPIKTTDIMFWDDLRLLPKDKKTFEANKAKGLIPHRWFEDIPEVDRAVKLLIGMTIVLEVHVFNSMESEHEYDRKEFDIAVDFVFRRYCALVREFYQKLKESK